MSEREFLKEKDLLLNSIEKNTAKHWENYYSNVPIKCIFEDLVIDINEIKRLTEENQELKQKYLNAVADYETTMFEKEQLNSLVNSCQEEIRRLKKQLEYLRSGEYYNQLRFENEMLQQVVDTNGVPSEVYDYIDCTHRNTELLKENQSLKKQLEVGEEQYNDLVEEKESLQEQLSSNTLQLEELKEQVSKGLYNTCLPYSTGYNKAIKDKETQQKEFIEYMNKTIEELEYDDVDDEEMKGYLIQKIDTFKEILSKYKSIIGGKDAIK